MEMKKLLTIGIICLFIGVAIAPSINSSIVKASNDKDLVKVTSQACGIQGFGNTTVNLTKQQYKDLEQYLVDFRARLNQTTTREEAIPIFKDAVVELNKYGLLPRGMSVEQAQRLVTGGYIPQWERQLVAKLWKNSLGNDTNESFLCLIYGSGLHPDFNIKREIAVILQERFNTFAEELLFRYVSFLYSNLIFALLILPIVLPIFGLATLFVLMDDIHWKIPVHLLTTILINGYGEILSLGINGLRNWTGFLQGEFNTPPSGYFWNKPGVIGFTGISIQQWDYHIYFIGTALMAKIVVE